MTVCVEIDTRALDHKHRAPRTQDQINFPSAHLLESQRFPVRHFAPYGLHFDFDFCIQGKIKCSGMPLQFGIAPSAPHNTRLEVTRREGLARRSSQRLDYVRVCNALTLSESLSESSSCSTLEVDVPWFKRSLNSQRSTSVIQTCRD